MGCTQSKIENQELISRCKQRKQQMKSAVAFRNALASAHSSYTMALKNTGASLSDYAHGEVHDLHPSSSSSSSIPSSSAPAGQFPTSSSSSVQPPLDNLLRPPPLPDHLTVLTPLHRAASLPGLPISNLRRKNSPQDSAIIEEDEHVSTADAESQAADSSAPAKPSGTKPSHENWDYFNLFTTDHIPTPSLGRPEESMINKADSSPVAIPDKGLAEPAAPTQHQKMMRRQRQSGGSAQHHRTGSAGGGLESKRGKTVANASQTVNLLLILKNLDDHFLKAYENANEVSKMLAATRLHYHSNFADNQGN